MMYLLGRRISSYFAILLVAFSCLAAADRLQADVFHLRSGATLRGQLLNASEPSRRQYVVLTEQGVNIKIDRSQVKEHVQESAETAAYDQYAPTVGDNAAEQWQLAEWCRERGLDDQRREHLRRVVELDPQRVEAWQALGYTELDGKWVTRQGFFEERGYVYYRGRWRLPQEVDVLEERRRIEVLEREWVTRLKTWRVQLAGDHAEQARQQIAEIRDPHALRALAEQLGRERIVGVRLLYLSVVSQIQDPRSIEILIAAAFNDPNEEVFHACVERLARLQVPGLEKVFVNALGSPNNFQVNRAAHVLGALKEQKAVPALIRALVTTHYLRIPSSGRTTTGIARSSLLGHTSTSGAACNLEGEMPVIDMGNAKAIPIQVPNQEVLKALVQLSEGQSFGFDKQAWTNWWSVENRTAGVPSAAR